MATVNDLAGKMRTHCCDAHVDVLHALSNVAFIQRIKPNFRPNVATIQRYVALVT